MEWLVSRRSNTCISGDYRTCTPGPSVGGCKLATEASVYIGMYLTLRVYLPGQETPLKVDQAAVRWAKEQQYGTALNL